MKLGFALLSVLFLSFGVQAQTIEEGIVKIEKEDYTGARSIFKQILAKNPKATEPYFYLGETQYQNERPDSAKYYYDKGIALNEDNALCYVGQAKLLLDNKNYVESKKLFEKAARRASRKDSRVPYEIGKAYFESTNKNYDEAITNIQKAIEINPKVSDYFSTLGDVYYAKRDPGKAVTNYEFASAKNENDPKNYLKRAKIWYNSTRYDLAEENLNKALAKDPNFAPAIKDLIQVYSAQKQFSKATPLLKRYTDLVGSDMEARERYVKFLVFYAKDYKTAIAEATKLLVVNPKNASMLRWITWGQLKDKDFANAFENGQKFFANAGDKTIIATDYENLAEAAKELKKYDVASENYMKIATVDSTRTDVYDLVGKMNYDANNYPKAIEAYNTKIKKGANSSQDYYYLGVSQYYNNDFKNADTTFSKLNIIAPKYLVGYNWKAKTAKKIEGETNTGKAIPAYEKVIELGNADVTKYKNYLIDAYGYTGEYYYNAQNFAQAIPSFTKLVEFDPANANFKELLDAANTAALGGGTTTTVPPTPAPKKN